ncbi:ribonuclease H-like domain-containing protein [Tanacetum coccineum]
MTVDNTTIDLLIKLLQQLGTMHVNNNNVANNCPSPPVAFATGTRGFVGPNNGLVAPINFSHSVPYVGPIATYPTQQAQPQQAHTNVLHQQPTQAQQPLPAQYTTPAHHFGYPVIGPVQQALSTVTSGHITTLSHAFAAGTLHDPTIGAWNMDTASTSWTSRGEVLCRLVSSNFISYNKEKPPVLCHACQLGKHVRLPFVSSSTVISSCFDIIHSDVWTSPIPSLSGFKYYVLFLDHYSQFVWVYPLVNKSDVMSKFVLFCNYVRTQFKCEIKSFQCDHGGEFDNRRLHTLFAQNGIQFRFSCPQTSQQNGKSERMKYLADGTLSRYKARLVANGSTQLEGVDAIGMWESDTHVILLRNVDETFSPVIKLGTIRTVLSLGASRHWPIHQQDVKNVFLHGDLSETKKYAIEILDKARMDNCNLSRTPIDNEYKLGSDGDPVYLHMHDPREPYFLALKRILRYIRGTLDYGLQLFSSSTTDLVAYSDADWAGCPTTRRSTSCYCVFLGNNLLSWSSKRQPTLSRSSAEAEYSGVANAVAETCWLRNLLCELHTPLSSATIVYCDNVSAVYLACNLVQHQRTKHIEIDIYFVRDLVAVGQVPMLHVSSRYQFADIFTKGLPSALFEEFRSRFSFLRVSLFLVLLMEQKGVLIDREELLRGDIRGETIVGDDSRLPQSPLVFSTIPLPLHQSNVDVATTFGVSLSTVGDLKVLITDIDAGKYGELLSRMTNDKRKIVFDALGALCDLINDKSTSRLGSESDGSRNGSNALVTMHMSSLMEEVLIHSIDDVAVLFGVPLNFSRILMNLLKILKWDTLLNLQKSAPTIDVNLSGEASPSDTILQSVDINTKSTFYVGAAGASAKDQPKVNSNFRHLVADPVFDGVNISIPRKVVKKKWSMDTRLLKEELIRIPIWVKLHDVRIQVFEEDGRSSFARCLIEVNSDADLVDVVTIGIPSLTGDGFTKETIRVEYEWRPPKCDIFKIFGHVYDHCPKKVVSPSIVTTSTVVTPTVKKSNDGFQTVTTSAPKKGTTNVDNASTSSSMLKTTGTSYKKDNISTSNSFFALNDDEEDEDEAVEIVYDESANLFPNTKAGENSFFMAATG